MDDGEPIPDQPSRKVSQADARQPTATELAERVDMCRQLLAKGLYDGQIKRAVAEHFKLSPRTVERYLRRAREAILAETNKSKDDHRADAYAFYMEKRRTAERDADQLRAQERIDKLLGTEAPVKQEHSGYVKQEHSGYVPVIIVGQGADGILPPSRSVDATKPMTNGELLADAARES